jgi:hypothetical protein
MLPGEVLHHTFGVGFAFAARFANVLEPAVLDLQVEGHGGPLFHESESKIRRRPCPGIVCTRTCRLLRLRWGHPMLAQ